MRQTLTRLAPPLAALALATLGCNSVPEELRLRAALDHRLTGDRTGACVAAAILDHGEVLRATHCASERRDLERAAFEIGSISKTMNAAMLASLIEESKLSLGDTLAQHAPAGVTPPPFAEHLTLAHLVTHTSGLPSVPAALGPLDPNDPYAALDEAALWAALPESPPQFAPGTSWDYSNYAVMLLSGMIARRSGTDLETLLRQRLFTPLGMQSYVSAPPAAVVAAPGHLPGGLPAAPWNFAVDLSGVGGVRGSLDDMIRYARAHLGQGDPATVRLLSRTHAALTHPTDPAQPRMAMGWILGRDKDVLFHNGGTGGFSSAMMIDVAEQRAAIVLVDTATSSLALADELAAHLFEASSPLSASRTPATAPAELLAALAGRYLVGGLEVTLLERDGLIAVLPDGAELPFGYDSNGDFYPLGLDALLTPHRGTDGRQTFLWQQGGAVELAERLP